MIQKKKNTIQKNNGLIYICGIYYQYKNNVASFTKYSDNTCDVAFTGQLDWEEIYFTKGSAELVVEQSKENVAGVYYNHKLSFQHPGEDVDITTWDDIARREILLKVVYNNGVEKLMGYPDNPVIPETSKKIKTSTVRVVNVEWDDTDENLLI